VVIHASSALSRCDVGYGAPMKINYATTKPGVSQEHTGTEVRIAAQGPQAAGVVGVTDQTGLFHTLGRALGIEH
jgi:alkaline phosphatase